jgi:hypothetical protein
LKKKEYKPTSKKKSWRIEPIGKLAMQNTRMMVGLSKITVRIDNNKSKWQNRYFSYRIEQNGNTKNNGSE